MKSQQKVKTRNAGEKLPDGRVVPEFLEFEVERIDGKEDLKVNIHAFGRDFKDIDEDLAKDLQSLESEGAIYSEFWDEASETFPKYKIKLKPTEIYEYVEATIADQEFSQLLRATGDEDIALSKFPRAKYANRVRNYPVPDVGGIKPKYWICRAAFYGPELEALLCGGRKERYEKLDWMPSSSGELLKRILDSFCVAVRQLKNRRGGRASFEMTHEFDVQDMLFVVLKSVFPDARFEEYTIKHAGSQKRIDIVIPSINSIIETKIVRDISHSRSVCEEVKIDIESYHVHPNCGVLWVFMYDPRGYVNDPMAIEKDLSGGRRIGDKEFVTQVLVRGP